MGKLKEQIEENLRESKEKLDMPKLINGIKKTLKDAMDAEKMLKKGDTLGARKKLFGIHGSLSGMSSSAKHYSEELKGVK